MFGRAMDGVEEKVRTGRREGGLITLLSNLTLTLTLTTTLAK
jgi:hypothetical protein